MEKMQFGKYTVEVKHTDKLLYPDAGITKGEVVEYYHSVAEHMLPHLKDRPITMQRFPDGIEAGGFYQKDISDYFPDWIDRVTVEKEGGKVTHVICSNAATLVYLANQACLTPHVWLSRRDDINRPDRLVFDLDPASDDFEPVRDGAKTIVEFLDELGLPVFAQTTGSRGVHIVVPLRPTEDFDSVRSFAQKIAELLASREPDSLTVEVRKNKRQGRLFLDTARNAYAQTMVAPYALRPRPEAPVATPIELKELSDSSLGPRSYNLKNILRRLSQTEDPWKNINRRATTLDKARKKVERMRQSADAGK
jgi:bifunctional non-homologous end joining protein LigD